MNKVVATLNISVDDELQLQTESGQVVVSSRVVAERFGKRHDHVLRAIKDKISTNPKLGALNYFIESDYKDGKGENRKEYLLTRDGFTFIVMGFTGAEADHWKLKYIEAFNKMEETLRRQKPMSFEEIMIAQLQEQQKIKQRLETVSENTNIAVAKAEQVEQKLDKQMTINSKQQADIQHAVKKKVGERLLACKQFDLTFEPSEHKAKFFSSLYGDLKRRFGTPTYKDILFVDHEAALAYVNAWIEPVDIR